MGWGRRDPTLVRYAAWTSGSLVEEGVGFEPTRACALAVFKTAAIDQLGHPSTLNCSSLAEVSRLSRGVCYGVCYGHPMFRARIRSASLMTMSLLSLA